MPETVYVAMNARNGSSSRYHTDKGCTRLKQTTEVVTKEREAVEPHLTLCKWCDGFTPEGGNKDWKNALLEADPDEVGV